MDAGAGEYRVSGAREWGVFGVEGGAADVGGEANAVVCVEFAVLDGACGVGFGAVGAG